MHLLMVNNNNHFQIKVFFLLYNNYQQQQPFPSYFPISVCSLDPDVMPCQTAYNRNWNMKRDGVNEVPGGTNGGYSSIEM